MKINFTVKLKNIHIYIYTFIYQNSPVHTVSESNGGPLSVTEGRSDEWIDIQTKNLVCNIGKRTKKRGIFPLKLYLVSTSIL